jgi:hypothetical protein
MAATGNQGTLPAPIPNGSIDGKKRKTFSVSYKLEILDAASALKAGGKGKLNAFLAERGLYSSHLALWRKQRAAGSLGKAKRGRPRKSERDLTREIQSLKRRAMALEKRAARAELLVELQRQVMPLKAPHDGIAKVRLMALMRRAQEKCTAVEACRAFNLSRRTYYGWLEPARRRSQTESPR